ncbi:MAG: DUF4249 domain-containing protein [Bacteroidota bacterium]
MQKLKFNKIFLFILLISVIISSCEDVVEVELNEVDIDLVSVEAYINTKPTDNIFVKLEKTLSVNTVEQNPAINNAIVEISDNEPVPNTIKLEEERNTGIYKIPSGKKYDAIPGRTYKITITTPDGIIITGEEYMQKVEKLDMVKINLSARGNFEFLAVFVNSQETPGPGHFYKWDIYNNGEMMSSSEKMSFVSDELVDGNYVYDFEIFTDFAAPDEEDEKEFHMGDTIYVEQLSISKSAYYFYYGMVNQAFSGSPFSVPPANLTGNLTSSDSKKVLGLFSARDISVGNTVVIDSTNYTPIVSSLKFLN